MWDRDNEGVCRVTNYNNNTISTSERYLDEFSIFIRQNKAVDIVHKVCSCNNVFLDSRVSSRKPFGIPSNYEPQNEGVPCHYIQKIGLKYAKKKDIVDSRGYLDKWKFLIPAAPIAGQTDFSKPVGFFYDGNTRISKPGECCTESWLVAGAFDSKEEAESYKSYFFTKTVRFLLLQTVVSQHISTKSLCFVPDLGSYSGVYTDSYLKDLWGLSDEEMEYIYSRIGEIGGD